MLLAKAMDKAMDEDTDKDIDKEALQVCRSGVHVVFQAC